MPLLSAKNIEKGSLKCDFKLCFFQKKFLALIDTKASF